MRTKKYYLTYLIWYSIAFVLVSAAVFGIFIAQGRGFVWREDGVSQYLPKAAYFSGWVRRILAGALAGKVSIPLYDFAIGLGNAVPFHFEPLYWLFSLFPGERMEAAYTLVLFARYYCAGLSMSVFLLYFRNGRAAALLGSFTYIYADYGMWAGSRHPQFLVPMILLPLCILSMEEICRRRRWYLCTLVIWIHLWCGYYFTYMDTLAMGVYFLIRFFGSREGRTCRNFFLRMRTIILSYLLGVMIGNITLVNSFASYLGSSRTKAREYGSALSFLTYGWKWPASLCHYFLTAGATPGNWMRLGFLPLVYVAVVVLFIRRGRGQLKAAVVTGAVFCVLPAVGFVFSGFSNINNRWCYMFAFVMGAVLAFTARDMLTLTKKEQILVAAASMPCFAICLFYVLWDGEKHGYFSLVTGAVLLLTLIVLWRINRARPANKGAVIGLLGLALVSHACYGLEEFAPSMGGLASEFLKAGTAVDAVTEMPLAAMDAVEDDSFYRAATDETGLAVQNASQMLNYRGTMYFSSTVSRIVQDFFEQHGSTTWNQIRLRGFGGRAFLDALASVKYYALSEDHIGNLPYGYTKYLDYEKNGETYQVFQNEMALPLGYTYDEVISGEELRAYDYPQRQEVMLQAAVLEDVGDARKMTAEDEQGVRQTQEEDAQDVREAVGVPRPEVTGKAVEITKVTCRNAVFEDHRITAEKKKGRRSVITFWFEGVDNAEVYLYIKGMRQAGESELSFACSCGEYEGSYERNQSDDIYVTGQDAYLIPLGYHEEAAKKCRLLFEEDADISFDELQIFCQPMDRMGAYVEKLREDVLEDVRLSDNRIRGNIALKEDKLLALSIVYDRGWTAYVDGKETELLRTNIMYMGLPLSAGEHTVELVYRMPGLFYSFLASAAGLLIFCAALGLRVRRRRAAGERNAAAPARPHAE